MTTSTTTSSATPVDGPKPARRGPGRPKGGQVLVTRAQLLAAAETLIRSDGPDVTMQDIAAAATITKPILYRTVGDKDALVAALSESLVERLNVAVAEATRGDSNPRVEFEAAVRGYLTAISVDRNLFLFVNAVGTGTDQLRRLVDQSSAQMIELFAAARARADGNVAAARTWAYAIIGAFQMVTMMWLRDEYCDLDVVAVDLTELLWSGVARVGNAG